MHRVSAVVALVLSLIAGTLVTLPVPVWAETHSGVLATVPPMVSPPLASAASTPLDDPLATGPVANTSTPPRSRLDQRQPTGFVEGVSRELVERRTATSSVYVNPDGTRTLKATTQTKFYRSGGSYVPIDSTLVPGATPGTYQSRANTWTVAFAPLPSGVTITSPDGELRSSPKGAAPVAPALGADRTSVTYVEAWPGVDLRYRVESDRVKEEILVKGPSGPSSFSFATNTGFSPNPDLPGGLVPDGPVGQHWRVAPAAAFDAQGKPATGSGVEQTPGGDSSAPELGVSVDASWLAGLPAAAFPIVVDPTEEFWTGAEDSIAFASDTGSCQPCQVWTGNFFTGTDRYWRTVVKFPYTELAGSRVLDAVVKVDDNRVNPTPQIVEMHHATALSYDGASAGQWIDSDYTDGVAVLEDPRVAAFYQGRVNAGDFGAYVGFRGSETPGAFTYQQRWAFELMVTYNRPPSVSLVQPANQSAPHTLNPMVEATSSDPDGDATERDVTVYADSALTQPVFSYQIVGAGGAALPDNVVTWGHTYYWRARVYDGWDWGSDSPVWSFTPTNAAPANPTLASPPDQAVFNSTALHFSTNAVADPDGDQVQYQFQAATGQSGDTGVVTVSPWSTSTTWDPPPGTFADGGTYYWTVKARDVIGAESARSDVRNFRVDFRLGQRASFPYDSLGGASVNLSNGNLVVGAAGPQFSTLGGSVGVSLAYNSQAPRLQGLYGDYYQDTNNSQTLDAGDVRIIRRLDPQLNFTWPDSPVNGVVPADSFLVDWNGYLTKPASETATQWVFEGDADDSLRIDVAGTNVLNKPCCGSFTSTAFTLSSTGPAALHVTLSEATADAYLHLKIRPAGPGAGTGSAVPSDWLSPTAPRLPFGWARGGDTFAEAAYTALRPTSSGTTVLVDDSGADHPFTWTGTAWKPPANEDGVLTKNDDNTWTLLSDDGYLYRFDAEGHLVDLVSAADDIHPGAPRYLYSTVAGGTRLDEVNDASNRSIYYKYGPERDANGNPIGTDPCPSAGGYQPVPSGMLCKVLYSGFRAGASTDLYYSNGQLARIVNPGGETTDFGYDAQGRMTALRDVLTNDLIAAGVFSDPAATTHQTLIGYDASGRVASVKSPVASAAMTEAQRPAHTYDYTNGTQTKVLVAGLVTNGAAARTVTLDVDGHATSDIDAAGVTTTNTWDSFNDRVTRTVAGGRVSAFVYDHAGRITDTYGPGSAAEVDAQPPTAARKTTGYDEGMRGLAAAYWANPSLLGAPKLHATGAGNPTGALDVDWGSGGPAGLVDGAGNPVVDGWSARYTGEIVFPTAGNYSMRAYSDDGVRVWVDDQLVSQLWTDHGLTYSPAGNVVVAAANTRKRIRVDYYERTSAAMVRLLWTPPGGAEQVVPGADLAPRYGLATSVTDNGERTNTEYARPELGLPTATVVDPSGLKLRTTTSYEPAGAGKFFRRTARNLPGSHVYKSTVAGDHPANDWRLGDALGSSTAADSAGTGPGTYAGGVTQGVPGALLDGDTAAAFAGSADGRVALPDNSIRGLGGTSTTEAWFKTTTPGIIVSMADAAYPATPGQYVPVLYVGTDGKLRGELWGGGVGPIATASSVADDAWHHAVLTAANNTQSLYLDGALVGTLAGTIDHLSMAKTAIGTGYWWNWPAAGSGWGSFTGTIDEVAVYPTALSPTAVQAHYQASSSRARATTYSYYGATEAPSSAAGACAGTTSVNQAGAPKTSTSPDPDGAGSQQPIAREYRYDAAGRALASRVVGDAAWTCTEYDGRGRVTRITLADGKSSTFAYGTPGQVTNTFSDSDGITRVTVAKTDWIGRPVAYTDEQGTLTETDYDQAGREIAGYRTFAGGARVQLTSSAYDTTTGRLASTTEYLSGSAKTTTYGYNPASGELTTTARPNGVTTTATYDANRAWLNGITNKRGTVELSPWTYTYFTNGKINSEATTGRTRTFTYDNAGRLSTTVDGATTRRYAYDANSNRCAMAATCDGTFTYDNADRLVTSPGVSGYSYDSHGNVTAAAKTGQPGPNNLNQTFTTDPAGGPSTFPITAGKAGPITASLNWSGNLPAPATTTRTGSLSPMQGSSAGVSLRTSSYLTGALSWTQGQHDVSSTIHNQVSGTAYKSQTIAATAVGTISASLDWTKSSTIGPYWPFGHVDPLQPVDYGIPVSANGTIDVNVTWPEQTPNPNLDLELLDPTGAVVASSMQPVGNQESLTYQVTGFSAYRDARLYVARVKAVGPGSNFTIGDQYPVFADLDLELYNPSGTRVAATGGIRKPESLTYAMPAGSAGNYELRVASRDYWANYTASVSTPTAAYADVAVAVKDGAGTVVASDRGSGGTANVAFDPASAGTYSVEVLNNSPDISVPSYSLAQTVSTRTMDTWTSGALPASSSTSRIVSAGSAGTLSSAVTYGPGQRSNSASSNVGVPAQGVSDTTIAAAAPGVITLDATESSWEAGKAVWSHAADPVPVTTYPLRVSKNGQLDAYLDWSPATPNSDLDLELTDPSGLVVASSRNTSGNSEHVVYSVTGVGAYPSSATYTLRVLAVGPPTAFTLRAGWPSIPDLSLQL
ncbi:MAG: hypothetical protein QOF60_768, partial [Actinomycetota bacterium]|nr:hypothetical protein [Actinomycetota bacterium]